MIVVIIIVAIIFLIAIISYFTESKSKHLPKRNEEFRRLVDIEAFKIEAQSRIRIFNDSLRLIQETNNVDTFIGRCKDLEESVNWIASKASNGMPIELNKPPLTIRHECNICINENALRLAKVQFDKWNNIGIKKGKRFDNATIKTFNIIDALLEILKTGNNKTAISNEILQIRNKVEDIYSDIK